MVRIGKNKKGKLQGSEKDKSRDRLPSFFSSIFAQQFSERFLEYGKEKALGKLTGTKVECSNATQMMDAIDRKR
jgi:hypothetical protein